jgi:hypothetical protein
MNYNNNGVMADQNMANLQMLQMNNMAMGANGNVNLNAASGNMNTGFNMGLGMGLGTGGAIANGILVLRGNCMST